MVLGEGGRGRTGRGPAPRSVRGSAPGPPLCSRVGAPGTDPRPRPGQPGSRGSQPGAGLAPPHRTERPRERERPYLGGSGRSRGPEKERGVSASGSRAWSPFPPPPPRPWLTRAWGGARPDPAPPLREAHGHGSAGTALPALAPSPTPLWRQLHPKHAGTALPGGSGLVCRGGRVGAPGSGLSLLRADPTGSAACTERLHPAGRRGNCRVLGE